MPRLAAFNFGARKFGFGSLFSSAAATEATYIEDVFSTYLYTGNGSTQTITNGIDLAGKGGLVWTKSRTETNAPDGFQWIRDTSRGITNRIAVNSTDGQIIGSDISSTTSSGFNLGFTNGDCNRLGNSVVSWTFREQPKFFDIVTYTGNDTAGRTIAHSLGSVPGCIIVKCYSADGDNWIVYHRSLGATKFLILNSTGSAITSASPWNDTEPTDTVFSVGGVAGTNGAPRTYVAYLFAHNAGGFGLSGSDNVISCGSFATDASGNATVTLGYEPQYILYKRSDSTGGWFVIDSMRGWTNGSTDAWLAPNTSAAESTTADLGSPTATGFTSVGLAASATYIYIAIRRGPMKVPTSGTSVFSPAVYTGNGVSQTITTNFVVDAVLNERRNSPEGRLHDRMRGDKGLLTVYTNAEATNFSVNLTNGAGLTWAAGKSANNAYYLEGNDVNVSAVDYVSYAFRRSPSFFDVVCYTGTGSVRTVTHNLGAVPQLIIIKGRDTSYYWPVYSFALGNQGALALNETSANKGPSGSFWDSTSPTTTNFTLGSFGQGNQSSATYVAYLFATCLGVSKVGSYTGTGTTQTINCGFTGGARFVLIKATSTTGDWLVADTARGLVSGNDPRLSLNTTAAEVTTEDWLDPDNSGFIVNQVAGSSANEIGVTYVYLAIA